MEARPARSEPRPSRRSAPGFPRAFVASTATHATVLGAGLLLGVIAAGSARPGPRAFTATLAPAVTPPFAPAESASSEPPRLLDEEVLPEPELREAEPWGEVPPAPDLEREPELEPAPRAPAWAEARPFDIGVLARRADPAAEPAPARAAEAAPAPDPGPRVVTEPVPLEVPAPPYPRAARRAGEEGSVLLRLDLDASGKVACVTVVESSGFERLDALARETLETWRFAPRREDGRAVASSFLHRVDFRLGDS